jgi:hypothetical protein
MITVGCLLAALGFYVAGSTSAAAFLLVGAAFEMAFWVRLVRGSKQP